MISFYCALRGRWRLARGHARARRCDELLRRLTAHRRTPRHAELRPNISPPMRLHFSPHWGDAARLRLLYRPATLMMLVGLGSAACSSDMRPTLRFHGSAFDDDAGRSLQFTSGSRFYSRVAPRCRWGFDFGESARLAGGFADIAFRAITVLRDDFSIAFVARPRRRHALLHRDICIFLCHRGSGPPLGERFKSLPTPRLRLRRFRATLPMIVSIALRQYPAGLMHSRPAAERASRAPVVELKKSAGVGLGMALSPGVAAVRAGNGAFFQ